jgi:hypothetical protein
MLIDKDEYWLSLRRAGIEYDSNWGPIDIGGLVLDGPGKAREITDEERSQIVEIAEEHSASK